MAVVCVPFSFCHTVAHPLHSSQKPSNLWLDLREAVEVFVSETGEYKKVWSIALNWAGD